VTDAYLEAFKLAPHQTRAAIADQQSTETNGLSDEKVGAGVLPAVTSNASSQKEQKGASGTVPADGMTKKQWTKWLGKAVTKVARLLFKVYAQQTGVQTGVLRFIVFCKTTSPEHWRKLVRRAIPQLILTDTITADLCICWPPRTSALSAFLQKLAQGHPPKMSKSNTGYRLKEPTLKAQAGKNKRKVAFKQASDSQESKYMQGRGYLSFQYRAADNTVLPRGPQNRDTSVNTSYGTIAAGACLVLANAL